MTLVITMRTVVLQNITPGITIFKVIMSIITVILSSMTLVITMHTAVLQNITPVC